MLTEIDLEKLLTKLDKSSFTSFEMTEGDFSIKVKKRNYSSSSTSSNG
ncbi:hypothetical protein [Pediococcus pentosaceus]|nr:hypothetical protein [Pediococcus pentosaceus]MCL3857887.1 hypothetical protein [Pediococcus pentosaceus]